MQNATPVDELRLHLTVLRCQTGDEQAFRQLFDWFGGRTLAHLRGLVGDDADDLQQEVWLSVYQHVAGLSNPRAFRTWLFKTTRHRAVDFLRRRRRQLELTDETAIADIDVAETVEEPPFGGIDESHLDAAIRQLPPLQREVLLLRYQDEMSYTELALVVGCPIGTVRTRLHHAKRKLHELLKRGHS